MNVVELLELELGQRVALRLITDDEALERRRRTIAELRALYGE